MAPQEAMEILDREIRGTLLNYPADLIKAQKLGIEALKRLEQMRIDDHILPYSLLPGETTQ